MSGTGRIHLLAAALLMGLGAVCGTARADEGMWLVNAIDEALARNMRSRGLELPPGDIYNEQAGGLCDAVVSLGFQCTGSIVSAEGLLITNHHCAFSDISALGTAERNYLETGFWAMRRDEEIPVPGKEVFFLRRVVDVTSEVAALKDSLLRAGATAGSRRISSLMEKRYAARSGKEASLSSMWAGEKYYMALYDCYRDVRLVGAPPVGVAAFGGDEDNWEWPQHKADFALYRVYTAPDGSPAGYSAGNIPLSPRRHLEISTSGVAEGGFSMVIGFPGHTGRYSPSAEMDHATNVVGPVSNRLRAVQMEIIRRGMERDPEVRRRYADTFFSLSNVAEMQQGEVACMRRFGVVERRRTWERLHMGRRYGELLGRLDAEYQASRDIERQKAYYRETLVRGLTVSRHLLRMGSSGGDLGRERRHLSDALARTDPQVERDLLAYSVEQFMENVDTVFHKPIHRELRRHFGTDYKAAAAYLWEGSCLSGFGNASSGEVVAAYKGSIAKDPLYRYIRELGIAEMNNALKHEAGQPSELRGEYVRARYRTLRDMGAPQYPDANSTMRLSYGRVCGLDPRDAVHVGHQSTAAGLREKYSPDKYDYAYPEEFKAALPPEDHPVDFLTDNDITGGNSGSPVLDSKGRLVGLAFDGNKESLAGNYEAVEGYDRCVCVDIRYIVWILRHYAHAQAILAEMGL